MQEIYRGLTSKLKCTVGAQREVHYEIAGSDGMVLQDLLGKQLKIEVTGVKACVACGKALKKTFQQGYCFPCTQRLAVTDMCQMKPETCHFALGTCRDSHYAEKQCMIAHTVYLARTSAVKVGVTREYQEETRWMDQGAVEALPIARAFSRRDAGLLEVAIAQEMTDKTHWRAMLKNEVVEADLLELRAQVWERIQHLSHWQRREEVPRRFSFPVLRYPSKVKSVNLDKQPSFQGCLTGIKGQYLMFDAEFVCNIRKYSGYEISWSVE
ncbi:MAG: DUF2797 domain-containing protein [Zetaproteobacteria bacterium]|nr:DUF2797 domain-containing protein [Zetaproteobacteria bacterium]